MPIQDMTPEEILLATAEQVASGAKSTDRANRLPGETASEANARITQAYKDLVAKPILTPELAEAGAEVKFVRQGSGGVGEYVIVTPIGTKIPADDATQWSMGIIPANSKYVTGTTLGMFSKGDGTVTNVGEVPVTAISKAGETSTRSFEGQDAYYTQNVGTTGKTQAQLDAAKGQETALQFNKDIAALLGGTVDPNTGKVTNVAGKTVTSVTPNADGTTTIMASDGTSTKVKTPDSAPLSTTPVTPVTPVAPTASGISGNKSATFNANANTVSSAVTTQTNGVLNNPFAPGSDAAKAWNERKSAYDLLYSEFNKYGLGTLIEPLKNLVQEGVSPSEFAIQLRNTPQYQKRFAANAKRVQNGLAALSEAEYIGLEDQYQNIMRNYGLPEQYYARGDLGVQAGFEQFIGNDVSPVELEDRIQTAERRVRYANPEVGIALKTFYPDITNGDVLAYALDPKTALESLKRRITAAEVGSTAVQMGLATNVTDAEYLARYGVTKAQAQQGYQTISSFLPRAQQLSDIYATQGVSPYTQATAEKEVFGVPGAADAAAQRKKIVGLETAAFSGSSGAAGGALARERAGGF